MLAAATACTSFVRFRPFFCPADTEQELSRIYLAPFGQLIGKIFLGQGSANLVFVERGLVILSGACRLARYATL